jgi:peptidoglycan-N-acetylglucosamine deacetylase
LIKAFTASILYWLMNTARLLRRWSAVIPLLAALMFLLGSNDSSAQATHVSSGEDCGRLVALTFDDGPNPPFTQQVLDILTVNGVRATFFVEGEAANEHPDVVRLLDAAGMDVEAHSYGHGDNLATASAADFRLDLEHVTGVLERILGRRPLLYRPPFGKASAMSLKELRSAGYTSVGWDVDSTDWRETDPQKITQEALSHVHPGAIVLLHDGGLSGGNPDRTATIEALPAIIAGLRDRGYELKTVPAILDPQVCDSGSP